MDNNLISNKELIEMGYRPHTANDIIHQARELLVSRDGCSKKCCK